MRGGRCCGDRGNPLVPRCYRCVDDRAGLRGARGKRNRGVPLVLLKATEQANLAGMIDVVEGNAVKHREMLSGAGSFENLADGLNQGSMLTLEYRAIGAPSRFRG